MSDRSTLWRVREERALIARPPFLNVYEQAVELPDGRVIQDYLRIAMRDFVVVVPRLVCGCIALLRQYKHGVGRVCYSFPGGMIEAGEIPMETAARELREEAGLIAVAISPLGDFVVNGNNGCGRAYLFQAEGCFETAPTDHDDLEEMTRVNVTRGQLAEIFRDGGIATLPHAAAYGLAGL